MIRLSTYLSGKYSWINHSSTPYGLHYSRSSIYDTEMDIHHRLRTIPVELLLFVKDVLPLRERDLPLKDVQLHMRSLSIMVMPAKTCIGPHRDATWVSNLTRPFDVWNLSDKEYTVEFSRVQPSQEKFKLTVPAWSRYCVEGEFRSGWEHSVGETHRRVVLRIGWMWWNVLFVCLHLFDVLLFLEAKTSADDNEEDNSVDSEG